MATSTVTTGRVMPNGVSSARYLRFSSLTFFLVACGEIDEVQRRLAAAHALDILDDLGNRRARLGQRRRVRRDRHAGMRPERTRSGKRLGVEDVEIRVAQMSRVQLTQQVGYDDMRTARQVDDARVLPQLAEVASVQEAA